MTEWKYKGFKGKIYTDWIYLLPSIEIHTMDYRWSPPQEVSISIHFLVFHLRWLWKKFWKGDSE